jgi:methylated-DNA-[protein]-cysteine S-methyltransferase
MPKLSIDTPIGRVTVVEEDACVTRLGWDDEESRDETTLLTEARRQLDLYFASRLTRFDLPLAPTAGSAFERRVWEALLAIPYGATRRYGDIALMVGGVARAVGGACGSNPIAIMIPCHRVIGTAGLTGFSGGAGIDTKRRLLDLERGQARLF